jgi:hypothetical protein
MQLICKSNLLIPQMAGRTSNMYDIVETMTGAAGLLRPLSYLLIISA